MDVLVLYYQHSDEALNRYLRFSTQLLDDLGQLAGAKDLDEQLEQALADASHGPSPLSTMETTTATASTASVDISVAGFVVDEPMSFSPDTLSVQDTPADASASLVPSTSFVPNPPSAMETTMATASIGWPDLSAAEFANDDLMWLHTDTWSVQDTPANPPASLVPSSLAVADLTVIHAPAATESIGWADLPMAGFVADDPMWLGPDAWSVQDTPANAPASLVPSTLAVADPIVVQAPAANATATPPSTSTPKFGVSLAKSLARVKKRHADAVAIDWRNGFKRVNGVTTSIPHLVGLRARAKIVIAPPGVPQPTIKGYKGLPLWPLREGYTFKKRLEKRLERLAKAEKKKAQMAQRRVQTQSPISESGPGPHSPQQVSTLREQQESLFRIQQSAILQQIQQQNTILANLQQQDTVLPNRHAQDTILPDRQQHGFIPLATKTNKYRGQDIWPAGWDSMTEKQRIMKMLEDDERDNELADALQADPWIEMKASMYLDCVMANKTGLPEPVFNPGPSDYAVPPQPGAKRTRLQQRIIDLFKLLIATGDMKRLLDNPRDPKR